MRTRFQKEIIEIIKGFFPKCIINSVSQLRYQGVTSKDSIIPNSTYVYFRVPSDGWWSVEEGDDPAQAAKLQVRAFEQVLAKQYNLLGISDGDYYDDGSTGIIVEVIAKRTYREYSVLIEAQNINSRNFYHIKYKALGESEEAVKEALFEQHDLSGWKINKVAIVPQDDECKPTNALVVSDGHYQVSGFSEAEKKGELRC